MKLTILFLSPATLLLASVALGDFDSGSDGSDGTLVSSGTEYIIDLSDAMTAQWDTPNTQNPGAGVYDPDLWCVVFKYQDVTIPNGNTVKFAPHPSGAPVVWLVEGDVQISGVINLNGQDSFNSSTPFQYSVPGPGGFPGGGDDVSTSYPASAGFGPGGGQAFSYNGGGYAADGAFSMTNIPFLQPLIGGSGGGGSDNVDAVGGAGGGAILIAASDSITIDGGAVIQAMGGAGGYSAGAGSGGAIRLVATTVSGNGTFDINAGSNADDPSHGWIRIEAEDLSGFSGGADPSSSISYGTPGLVFPPSNVPRLRATLIDGQSIPVDPKAIHMGGMETPDVTVGESLVWLEIEANYVPLETPVVVQLRPGHGAAVFIAAPSLEGSFEQSSTSVLLNLDAFENMPVAIQLVASW